MNVIVNVLIQLLLGNYLYHYYCLTFYCILQNKSKITLLTFLNVDGAFNLAEICRNQEDLSASVC